MDVSSFCCVSFRSSLCLVRCCCFALLSCLWCGCIACGTITIACLLSWSCCGRLASDSLPLPASVSIVVISRLADLPFFSYFPVYVVVFCVYRRTVKAVTVGGRGRPAGIPVTTPLTRAVGVA